MKIVKKSLFCTCHTPEHTLQLTVMQDDPEDLVWFNWIIQDGITLRDRVVLAFNVLFRPKKVVLQETAISAMEAINLGASLIRDVRLPANTGKED